MSARQPFTPTPSRPSSRATNPDQSLPPASARSRLTHSSASAQPHAGSNGDGEKDGSMQPLNLTGLKANKQMRKSVGGPQRVPHNAMNAPPQSAIRNRASLSASSTPGGGGGGIVAPRPLSPYVSTTASTIGSGDLDMDMDMDMGFKTPALPFPPGFYATNAATGATGAATTATSTAATTAGVPDDSHTHISTDNRSRQQPQQHRHRHQQPQDSFAHPHSDDMDPAADDSGYASSTTTSHIAHISTRTRKRAAYVDVDVDGEDLEVDVDGHGEDRQGKRFRYDLEGGHDIESGGGAEFFNSVEATGQQHQQQQEIPSRRSSASVGISSRRGSPVIIMRPPSVVAYARHDRQSQAQDQAQGQDPSMARMAFFEAILGLDVDLDEGEIERYVKAFEGYQARWTRDHDNDNDNDDEGASAQANEQGRGQGQGKGKGHGLGLGLEEWDKGGDELVGKFERVIKMWKEDMVATVTSYQSISQDLDDHRAVLAERAHEYQTVKEGIVRDRGGFKV